MSGGKVDFCEQCFCHSVVVKLIRCDAEIFLFLDTKLEGTLPTELGSFGPGKYFCGNFRYKSFYDVWTNQHFQVSGGFSLKIAL